MSLEPYYQDNYITEHYGHVLDVLKNLLDNSIQCCVTSPPYWGLRNYGLEPQIWDGQDGCEHVWGEESLQIAPNNTEHNGKRTKANGYKDHFRNSAKYIGQPTFSGHGSFCQLCGAWRGSLGLEPTPELYIQHIVQIWREIKRVLRKDGTCWLNIGDSYWGSGNASGHTPETMNLGAKTESYGATKGHSQQKHQTYKPKDLCMIPARVALALQADGWWLRSDIIWAKPNPMPESVTDRPTNSHEHIFLLTKSSKYFYDADAVREEGAGNKWGKYSNLKYDDTSGVKGKMQSAKNLTKKEYIEKYKMVNLRNVWNIATEPTPEAHFATFPKKLASTCIKAGSKIGDIVLDPFSGSGKTMMMAKQLRRKGIGIDLNSDYLDMPKRRLAQEVIPFN